MRTASVASLGIGALAFVIGTFGAACKGPRSKSEVLRDALVDDNASAIADATKGLPSCPEAAPVALAVGQPSPLEKGCLSEIANALGSKAGFTSSPPDQASAATAAVVLLRDGRGDWLGSSDRWLDTVKTGKGSGADSLRLAMARRMVEAAPLVGKKIDDDKDALAAMKSIAMAVPGACVTYHLLGTGADPNALAPELTAEHSACVQHDLARREGMGPSYGAGTFRALEGSLALWREAERALRLGVASSAPAAQTALTSKLATVEKATSEIAAKKLPGTVTQRSLEALGAVHADAGVILWRDAGAAPEAGAAPLKKSF
ncbi:hypothetical protein AKJ09_10912 [Labilithrix luteola]|uniref:Lipoprotein n=1 Tax=Labilithrix luteola TaxID=1391654 RepID=A0A0K1QER5_9BACT|nr:hypothetical protein [Labilithrix luteola]AKV04249.1 hypothetical protein AKJ09_10912 [Labilithrix luteola]